MEGLKEDIEQTVEITKKYLKTELDLIKVAVVENASKVLASVLARVGLIVLLVLPFLFGLAALAFYLSDIYGSHAAGFGLVAGGIAVLYIIGLILRKYLIVNPLQDYFIREFAELIFKDDADKEENRD